MVSFVGCCWWTESVNFRCKHWRLSLLLDIFNYLLSLSDCLGLLTIVSTGINILADGTKDSLATPLGHINQLGCILSLLLIGLGQTTYPRISFFIVAEPGHIGAKWVQIWPHKILLIVERRGLLNRWVVTPVGRSIQTFQRSGYFWLVRARTRSFQIIFADCIEDASLDLRFEYCGARHLTNKSSKRDNPFSFLIPWLFNRSGFNLTLRHRWEPEIRYLPRWYSKQWGIAFDKSTEILDFFFENWPIFFLVYI